MRFLDRLTLHQLWVLDWPSSEPAALRAAVCAALEEFAQPLQPAAAQELRQQLAADRPLPLHARDIRFPLVQSSQLYPFADEPALTAAFFAYQDGSSLLLHLLWHRTDERDQTALTQLVRHYWSGPARRGVTVVGESRLLTAVPMPESSTPDHEWVQQLLAAICSAPLKAPLAHAALGAATFYAPQWMPHEPSAWPALLLFQDCAAEATPAADHLATVTWPQLAHYRLRLDHHYLTYRAQVAPRLEQQTQTIQERLAQVFGGTDGRAGTAHMRLFQTANPQALQRALTRLAEPQYQLLAVLGAAEETRQVVARDLHNLQRSLAQVTALAGEDALLPTHAMTALNALIADRGERQLAQLQADVGKVEHEAERAERAVEVLRTQADIFEAHYELRLTWIISVVGILLALGQIIDETVAQIFYEDLRLGALWQRWGGLPLGEGHDDLVLFGVRLLSILVLTALICGIIALWMAFQRWRHA
jgi:hypothetical protein